MAYGSSQHPHDLGEWQLAQHPRTLGSRSIRMTSANGSSSVGAPLMAVRMLPIAIVLIDADGEFSTVACSSARLRMRTNTSPVGPKWSYCTSYTLGSASQPLGTSP